jgi:hypothetical protein
MVKTAGLKIDANGLKQVGRGGMIQHTVAAKLDVHAYRVQNLKTITKKAARLKRASDFNIGGTMRKTIERCKNIFDAIASLQGEGIFKEEVQAMLNQAEKLACDGFDICEKALQPKDRPDASQQGTSPDENIRPACPDCGEKYFHAKTCNQSTYRR